MVPKMVTGSEGLRFTTSNTVISRHVSLHRDSASLRMDFEQPDLGFCVGFWGRGSSEEPQRTGNRRGGVF